MKGVAIILIVAGILMLIFRGFSFTQEKKLVDLGPLEINKKEKKSVGWPVYAGGLSLAAGIIILVASNKKRELLINMDNNVQQKLVIFIMPMIKKLNHILFAL